MTNTAKILLATIALLLLSTGAGWYVNAGSFIAMFREFGAQLPILTRLALSGWYPLTAVVVTGALVALGVQSQRMPFLVAALLTPLVFGALFFVAMYLPLWVLASNVE